MSEKLEDKYIYMCKVNEYLFSLLTKRQLDKFMLWEDTWDI